MLFGIILMFPVLQAGFWLNTRRLRGRPAPEYLDLLEAGTAPPDQRVLFYFYSSHCGPCRTMTPRVEALETDFSNIVMVDIDEHDELTCRFGVSAVPSVIVVNEGRIERAMLGKQSERALRALLGTSPGTTRSGVDEGTS
ncbi:MAG: thioredoxin family protein [Gammaproteobacteria bacterium]|nr:thioredoxin family protein [Gammaproteobacteria bacterium]